MPLYEYECEACGQRFEVIVKFSDEPVEVCRKCGKGPVRKLMSSPAIQFKGTGWYITDYAKKDQGAATKTESGNADKKEKADKPAEASSSSSTSTTPPPSAAPSATKKD